MNSTGRGTTSRAGNRVENREDAELERQSEGEGSENQLARYTSWEEAAWTDLNAKEEKGLSGGDIYFRGKE